MAVRCVIVCDIRIYLDGIVLALDQSASIEVVGAASDLDDASCVIESTQPDVAIVDIAMPASADTIVSIHEAASRCRIIALTFSESLEKVVACARAGVTGVVSRNDPMDELRKRIYAVHAGESYCTASMAQRLLQAISMAEPDEARSRPFHSLTRRQSRVLELVELGQSNKQIALSLGIGLATVKNHVHSILQKLGVETRGEAAAVFRRNCGVELRLQPETA